MIEPGFLTRFFFLVIALSAIGAARLRAAETVGAPDPLPVDPKVIKKTLPNGLTYYVRENRKPENRAVFRLVVDAGSVLETDEERGLAHFLEHMAFNGTRNFEKQELVNFLERIGMRFGADLNAYTSFDETVYMLEVPMDDPEILDNTFLVLSDWAGGISFDQEEIEKERGVVIEEWRTRRGAQGRLQDKQIPVLFHNSKYAERLPIGMTNVIATVDRDAFVSFYKKWYRPELMAVIAVGDFDAEVIEQKIVDHFQSLENPENPPARSAPPVPDHDETLFSIETDPELSYTLLQIACKHPPGAEGSAADYRRGLVERLYSVMMNRRLSERVQEANPPYLQAGVGKSAMVRVKDVATQLAVVKENQFGEGLKALLTESRRARRDGFADTELERAKADLLRSIEEAHAERDKTPSARFADEYSRNYLKDEPIPGIEMELEMTRRFFDEITVAEVNHIADRWITESNRVILFSAPEKPGSTPPTRKEILAVMREAEEVEIAAYDDGVSDAPLVSDLPAPGTIVAENRREDTGTIEWVLSNDVRVLLKPTDFQNDQVLMTAFSPGGTSLVDDPDFVPATMATTVVGQSGLGDYDLVQLGKKLSGKVASVGLSIDELYETMSGSASPKDLETWFQLIHLNFVAPRADEKTFESLMARFKVVIENRTRNPQAVFSDAIEKALYGDHPRHRPLSLEWLAEMNRTESLEIYRDRFGDASDFTFVFVGSFEPETLRPHVETYLASLPDLDRIERGRDVGDDPKPGRKSVTVEKGIEPKSSVGITFHGDAEWSNAERYALRSAVDVLRIRLREVLREDKGGVYGVSVRGGLERYPEGSYSTGIAFTCSPDNVDELIEAALSEVKALQENGPSMENLNKVRETHLRDFEKGLKENGFWLGNLAFYVQNDLPPEQILTFPDRANALTPEIVRDAAIRYFSTENMLVARLMPETPSPSP